MVNETNVFVSGARVSEHEQEKIGCSVCITSFPVTRPTSTTQGREVVPFHEIL